MSNVTNSTHLLSCHYTQHLKRRHKDAYWDDGGVVLLGRQRYPLAARVDWLADPYMHRSWRWLLNSFKWMDSLIYSYIYRDDIESIEKCVRLVLDWFAFYVIENRTGEFLWKDDAVSFRAPRIAVVLQYLLKSNDYSGEEKLKARTILAMHYEELINPIKFKFNNHGIFQMRGLVTLSHLNQQYLDLTRAIRYATTKLNELWIKQYGTQAMHLENSTAYHQIIIREFEELLSSDEFAECQFIYTKDDIAKAKENSKHFYHPNGMSTIFGDSNISESIAPVSNGNFHFKEAGYFFSRKILSDKANSYLAVRTGFPSNIHRHSDDFSFEWSVNSKIILQDSGRYSYDYDNPFRQFVSSSRAHNTVTVDGTNFPWWGSYQKQDFYESAVDKIRAENNELFVRLHHKFRVPDIEFTREFTLNHGKNLFINDNLVSENLHDYEQWFHLHEDFAFVGQTGAGSYLFKCSDFKISVECNGFTGVEIVKGRCAPSIQGWVSYREREKTARYSIGFFAMQTKLVHFQTKFIVIN